MAVEIGAEGEDDERLRVLLRGVREQLHEQPPLLLVAAEREDLLGLVDDQHHPRVA